MTSFEEEEQPFPRVTKTLLKELETRFPSQCPRPDDSEREIWMAVGRRQVVDLLKEKFDDQNKTVLTHE
jgi:hypothetical protein